MQETITTCDACGKKLDEQKLPLDIIGYDLCRICIRKLIAQQLELITLRIDCEGCKGEGKLRVTDYDASDAQASCGENRTQYKIIECNNCFHG